MIRRSLAGLFVALALFPAQVRADGVAITRKQYQLYKDYKDALDDARVQKMKEADRLPAIAKNFKVPLKELKEAVEAGERDGAQIEPTQSAALKAAFTGSPLEGHLGDVSVDASKGHIVAYIQWTTSGGPIDQEACFAAARAAKAAPLAGTYFLTAVDGSNAKVFQKLISNDNANRIKEDQIVDFATTRYTRLFEKRDK